MASHSSEQISRKRPEQKVNQPDNPAPAETEAGIESLTGDALLTPGGVLRLQRLHGNAYVQRLMVERSTARPSALQREESGSHPRGCGCSACGGERIQRSIDTMLQVSKHTAVQRSGEQHSKGCNCASCSGQIQRDPDDEALMSVDPGASGGMSVDPGASGGMSVDPSTSGGMSVDPGASGGMSVDPGASGGMSVDPSTSGGMSSATTTATPTGVTPTVTPTAAPKTDADIAKDYLAAIIAENDPSKAGTVTRKDMLDKMQAHLTAAEFATAAAHLMLSLPASVVDKVESKKRAIEILETQLVSKDVARTLLDKNTFVIVIPKNKKMTDVVEFDKLKGTKTFDGRDWETVRGAGGFKVPGVDAIYVAVSEENTTGTSATGDAAGTDWCYSPGYSTTVHELAHVVDIHGLSSVQRGKIDAAYNAKHALDASGTAQEWIDGYNVTGPDLTEGAKAAKEWETAMPGKLTTAGVTDAGEQAYLLAILKYSLETGNQLNADAEWIDKLKLVHAVNAGVTAIQNTTGATVFTLDGTKKPTGTKKVECYASVHRAEYWAQSATAWFGSNVGKDPYTQTLWAAKGDADKANRRNGKSEVERLDPEVANIMKVVFADKTIADLNKPKTP